MWDFTKNITLEPIWQKRYQKLRALLYGVSIAWALVIIYGVLFPSISYDYSFAPGTPDSKNTIIDPRDGENKLLDRGVLPENKNLLMDTSLLGNFSDATINVTLDKNTDVSGDTLLARKAYRAFLYPVGDPIGFKEGSLLFSQGNFYIISGGEKRQFASKEVAQELGFTPDMFIAVDAEELNYNKTGPEIVDTSSAYFDGTLFMVDGNYYQLKNNQLYAFVSEKAFLSRYDARLAMKKDKTFLTNFDLADDQIGLEDGTLAAIGTSVSILSKGKSYPIFSPQIFLDMGYNWNDVYPANAEEVGIYKKQKLFMQGAVHPDGTIFKDAGTETYYIIEDGQKRPIIGTHLVAAYTKITPVIVDSSSLNNVASCAFKKNTLSLNNSYSCTMPLAKIINEKGNDYQFLGKFNSEVRISQMQVTFNTAFNVGNMRNSISHVKASVVANYASQ